MSTYHGEKPNGFPPHRSKAAEMLTHAQIIKKIEASLEKINRYGVKRIGVFGSYGRGEQKAESDIDILVEFEKDQKTFDNYMDLKFLLEDLFRRKVDLVIVEAIKSDLKSHIMGTVRYASGI
jgi:predicted nucleotidyltransferase